MLSFSAVLSAAKRFFASTSNLAIAGLVLFAAITAQAQVTSSGTQSNITGPVSGGSWGGAVGVASDSSGTIYIGQYALSSIYKVNGTTHALTPYLSGSISCGGTSTSISHPQLFVMDSSNNLYIANEGIGNILVINTSTATCTKQFPASGVFSLALSSGGDLYWGSNVSGLVEKIPSVASAANGSSSTPVISSGLLQVNGLAFARNAAGGFAAGDLVVSDYGAGKVYQYTASSSYASRNTVATGFSQNFGVMFDTSNNLYLSVTGANDVVEFFPGSNYAQSSSVTVVPYAVGAEGIGQDPSGNLYFTAYANGGSQSTVTELCVTNCVSPTVAQGSTSTTISVVLDIPAGTTVTSINQLDQGVTGTGSEFNAPGSDSNPYLCTAKTYTVATVCDVDVVFTPSSPGLHDGAITLTNGSTLLGTFYITGTGTGGQAGFTPGTISTVAGNGNTGYVLSQDGGVAISAALNDPAGVAVDPAGNFYIADAGNNRIRKVAATTGIITTVAGNGTACATPTATPACGDTGAATSAQLNQSLGVALDGAGNIYIADTYSNRIRKVTAATGIITTVAGTGTEGYVSAQDGAAATSAELSLPNALAVDGAGNIYIADTDNQRIRKVTAATGIITTVAGTGSACATPTATPACGDTGAATSAQLNYPEDVAVDGSGNIYIGDRLNQRIRKVTASTGIITTVAGNGVQCTSSATTGCLDGGAATSAQLDNPEGVSLDAAGNIYIGDTFANRIRKVTASTGIITTVAGNGSQCGTSATTGCFDGGAATSGEFHFPNGIALDGAGDIYISDLFDNRIREVTAGAAPVTFATSTTVGTTDTTDGAYTLTLTNNGNTALTFPVPGIGTDPSVPTGFTLGVSATCPLLTTSSSAGTLASGASCTYPVSFAPTTTGSITGSMVITDSASPTTQSVSLSGNSVGAGDTSTTTVGSSVSATDTGLTVNLTATIKDTTTPATVPTGSVTFTDTVNSTTVSLNGGTAVTLSSGVATLNGATLTGVGTHTITANYAGVSGSFLSSSNTATVTVNSAVSATQAVASTTLTQNHAATSFTPVTGGSGTGTLSYSVSPTLPAGLSMASATGAITGTPTGTSTAATYTVTVTDAVSGTKTATFSLAVNGAVSTTQAIASKGLTVNYPVTSFTPVTGSGGTGTLSYSVSPTLPPGIAMSPSTGAITGLPTTTSSATTYTVTVTDTNGATSTATFSLAVNGSVTATQSISSTALTQNHAATSFTPVTGGGGTTPYAYSVSPSLPAGLSINSSTGAITGTATGTSSAATYTVTVTDANGATNTATFSLTVNGSVTATQSISSKGLTVNTAATSFTPITGGGGTTPYTYSVSPSLPAGLSINPATGAITGTPTGTSSAATYTVTVTDANGATNTATFSLTVNGAVTATQSIASEGLTVNTVATSFTPITGGGGTAPYTYSVTPSLPAGLTLNTSTGAITGTATGTLTATSYTVKVTDANGANNSASFSLTVNGAVTATQSISSEALTVNTATPFTPITGGGGTTPYTYTVSPALPAGLSINPATGAITGTATGTSSAATYTVTVKDTNGATNTATFSLAVNGAVVATQSVSSKSLTVNTATSFTPITGSGGTAPLSYSVTPALPANLTLNTSTGVITGTATGTLTATSYTVKVTDANGATNSASFSLTVNGAVVATQSSTSPVVLTLNLPATSFTPVTGSGGTGTLSYSISPTLPTGLSLSTTTGAITGTPTVISTAATYTVTVTDTNSATSTATFSLAVGQASQTIGSFTPPATSTYGAAPITLTATGGASGSPVTFSIVSGPGTVSGTNGSTLTITGAGTIVVAANQAGNASYLAATQVTASIVVSKATPVDGLAASTTSILTTNTETLTATISSGISTPTGSVNFMDGTTLLSTVALTNGVAVLNISTLAIGSHSITAVYSGDNNFVSFTSSAQSITVLDFNLNISTSAGSVTSVTVAPGATATYLLTISPVGASTFPATVNLTVTGLPKGATYTITPSSITSGSGVTNVTLTVIVPAQIASLQHDNRLMRGLAPFTLALLLLPFSRRMRRGAGKLGRPIALLLLVLAGSAAVVGLSGCGSTTGFFAQPQQNYTLIVTGTSGTLSHSTNLTLTVE